MKQSVKTGKRVTETIYRPPYNFLGLSEPYNAFTPAKVIVLPIPFEPTTSYRSGTKEGPRAILDASRYVEWYDDELDTEVYKIGIHTLPELDPILDRVEKMIDRIEQAAQEIINRNKFLVGLGGEHSITLGIVRALHKKYPTMSVLQLDAHADLRARYEGTKFSHACVMHRIQDLGIKTVGVGIRSMSREEAEYVKLHRKTASIYPARTIKQHPECIAQIISELNEPVYVSIDIDAIDPSLVPGTGTPEPGGFDWYEITSLLREVSKKVDIVGFDVVELLPLAGEAVSEYVTARLIYKFLGYIFQGRIKG